MRTDGRPGSETPRPLHQHLTLLLTGHPLHSRVEHCMVQAEPAPQHIHSFGQVAAGRRHDEHHCSSWPRAPPGWLLCCYSCLALLCRTDRLGRAAARLRDAVAKPCQVLLSRRPPVREWVRASHQHCRPATHSPIGGVQAWHFAALCLAACALVTHPLHAQVADQLKATQMMLGGFLDCLIGLVCIERDSHGMCRLASALWQNIMDLV